MEALADPTRTDWQFFDFADKEVLAKALAERVATGLKQAITQRGHAVLAVSGGTTPKRFFNHLSQQQLNWPDVSIVAVDERWVAPDSARSNEKLIRENLLTNHASPARFVPLTTQAATPEAGLKEVAGRIAKLPSPIDVAVLGMGTDGHTASFFPGGDRLGRATDPAGTQTVSSMRAPGAGEPRITLTLPVLVSARHLVLHIEGAEKRAVFKKVLDDGPANDMPIRHIMRHRKTHVDVYWAP